MEIKDYNVAINGRTFFDQPIKNDLKTYDIILERFQLVKVMITQTGSLLDYPYFKKYYKLIAIDLSKQQKLDAHPKAIQQINFTGNISRAEGATMFFIIKEVKKNSLTFLKRNS